MDPREVSQTHVKRPKKYLYAWNILNATTEYLARTWNEQIHDACPLGAVQQRLGQWLVVVTKKGEQGKVDLGSGWLWATRTTCSWSSSLRLPGQSISCRVLRPAHGQREQLKHWTSALYRPAPLRPACRDLITPVPAPATEIWPQLLVHLKEV